jgi:hypothetical protein
LQAIHSETKSECVVDRQYGIILQLNVIIIVIVAKMVQGSDGILASVARLSQSKWRWLGEIKVTRYEIVRNL